jgi:hypothetical protein
VIVGSGVFVKVMLGIGEGVTVRADWALSVQDVKNRKINNKKLVFFLITHLRFSAGIGFYGLLTSK